MSMNALASSSAAVSQNLERFAAAAERLSSPGATAEIAEIVEMKMARQGVTVNGAVFIQANEMVDHLLDIIA